MKKEIVEEAIVELSKSWKAANMAAWSTVGRPGPVFTPGDIGDWDYVEECWGKHHAQVDADEKAATEKFWAALRAAPAWLRLSRPWLEDAWNRAFIDAHHGWYVGHHCMPGVQDVFKRLEL